MAGKGTACLCEAKVLKLSPSSCSRARSSPARARDRRRKKFEVRPPPGQVNKSPFLCCPSPVLPSLPSSPPIHSDQKDPQISDMNPLTKTDGRRGKGGPRTHPPSVRATGTCGSVAGAAGTRSQAGAIGVPQADAGVRRVGGSPVGGWWPT